MPRKECPLFSLEGPQHAEYQCDQCEINELEDLLEAAEQLAVWVARKGVMVGHDECMRPCVWFDVHRGVEHDGTDADLLRALKEASGIDHSTE